MWQIKDYQPPPLQNAEMCTAVFVAVWILFLLPFLHVALLWCIPQLWWSRKANALTVTQTLWRPTGYVILSAWVAHAGLWQPFQLHPLISSSWLVAPFPLKSCNYEDCWFRTNTWYAAKQLREEKWAVQMFVSSACSLQPERENKMLVPERKDIRPTVG